MFYRHDVHSFGQGFYYVVMKAVCADSGFNRQSMGMLNITLKEEPATRSGLMLTVPLGPR